MTIAETILKQLGGNRFATMTGSKNFAANENGLTMKLARNRSKANHLRITLNSMDTYDVEFLKVTNPTVRNNFAGGIKTLKEFNNIYADQLTGVFEANTGLYTSL